jgi:hypothetical protein
MANTAVTVNNFDREENKHTLPFCEYQKAGKRRSSLHEQVVDNGREYQCKQCDYKTTKKGNLTVHILFDCDQQECTSEKSKLLKYWPLEIFWAETLDLEN